MICSSCQNIKNLRDLQICETTLRKLGLPALDLKKDELMKHVLCQGCLAKHPWNCQGHMHFLVYRRQNSQAQVADLLSYYKRFEHDARRYYNTAVACCQHLKDDINNTDHVQDPAEMNTLLDHTENRIISLFTYFEQLVATGNGLEQLKKELQEKQPSTSTAEATSSLSRSESKEWDERSVGSFEAPPRYVQAESPPRPNKSSNRPPLDDDWYNPNVPTYATSLAAGVRHLQLGPRTTPPPIQPPYNNPNYFPSSNELTALGATPDEVLYTQPQNISYDYMGADYHIENAVRKRWHVKLWGLCAVDQEISFRIENKSETPMLIRFEQWTAGMVIRFRGSDSYQERREFRRAFELNSRESEMVKVIMTPRVRASMDEFGGQPPSFRFHGIGQLMDRKYNFVARTISCPLEDGKWKPIEI
ncbi:unnamed protein product, partial [Mesorhabditis spiculigera]